MTDIADKAQELIERKLAEHINKAKTSQPTRISHYCANCDEPLNDFRRTHYYATCVECAEELEK